MRWEELSEQPCSLARVLAILGDRWTLLVLRDCFLGVRRFDDFERSLGVTRHVLADRLKRLVEAEILAKVPYQERRRCARNTGLPRKGWNCTRPSFPW